MKEITYQIPLIGEIRIGWVAHATGSVGSVAIRLNDLRQTIGLVSAFEATETHLLHSLVNLNKKKEKEKVHQ